MYNIVFPVWCTKTDRNRGIRKSFSHADFLKKCSHVCYWRIKVKLYTSVKLVITTVGVGNEDHIQHRMLYRIWLNIAHNLKQEVKQ